MTMVPVGEYLPDLPALENPGATEAKNVIPAANGYRPFPSLSAYGGPLAGRAQGAFATRDAAGNGANFAADATKLYKLSAATWSDVSRTVGGPYATALDGGWDFAQFGDLVIAVNFNDAPQKWQLGASANFAALGGNPPNARFVVTVRDFVVLGRVAGFPGRVKWSGINNAETWTVSPTTQSDQQDLPDGGWIQGIIGGEFGTVLQERAIKRMTYVGAPLVFQFDEISGNVGATIEGSIAAFENMVFFAHASGFYLLRDAKELQAIGDHKVDRHFWTDIDQSYLYRVSAAVDPVGKLYVISYPGAGHSGGLPNKVLIYNWAIGRWSRAEADLELVYPGLSQAGYTLEGLDAVSVSLDALPFSLDSAVWAGVGRPLLAGFNSAHRLGYFQGGTLNAVVETTEAQLVTGQRALVRAVRPLVEGDAATAAAITLQLGTRNTTVEPVTWAAPRVLDGNGLCPVRSNARYHRARISIAPETNWSQIRGVDEVRIRAAGTR